MPHLDTPLYQTLKPAYDRLDAIQSILESEGENVENSEPYVDNLIAWFKLGRVQEYAKLALEAQLGPQ